ncbi:MAG: hypothetical protein ACMUEL_05215 [Flavobacteriales bacterium Tduv]
MNTLVLKVSSTCVVEDRKEERSKTNHSKKSKEKKGNQQYILKENGSRNMVNFTTDRRM